MSIDIELWKARRKALKMSYKELEETAGIPVSTLHNIFCGYTTAPRIDTVTAIENALGFTSVSGSTSSYVLTKDEKTLLNGFRRLTAERQEDLLKMLSCAFPEYRSK